MSGKGETASAVTDLKSWKVDTSYLPKLFARRFSRLSKMALYVSYHCLFNEGVTQHMPSVFCSRYGEFMNTYSVMGSIYQEMPVSPMDFSHAVYNTSQGLSSILTKDASPSVMVSATEDVIENGCLKAMAMLEQGAEDVLLVYHEDSLHDDYRSLVKADIQPLAFACVVSKSGGDTKGTLTLSSNPSPSLSEVAENHFDNQHALHLAELLKQGHGKASLSTSRLHWSWSFASNV